MGLVPILYLIAVVVLSVEVPLRSIDRRNPIVPQTSLSASLRRLESLRHNPVVRILIIVLPFSLVTFLFAKAHVNWWMPYLQLSAFFCGIDLLAALLRRRLKTSQVPFIVYALLLFCCLGVFWAAPVLQYVSKGPDVASMMLYGNPLLFAARPLAVDVFRMPMLYGHTPLSQMFIRYPNPVACLFILISISAILLLAICILPRNWTQNQSVS